MFDISESILNNIKIIKLNGRIDGVSSEDINIFIAEYLDKGNRRVILDFNEVNYISSAGLRVLLVNQKKITSAGGEIFFYQLPPYIKDVFKLSGFLKLFKIVEDENELFENLKIENTHKIEKIEIDNIQFDYSKLNSNKSNVKLYGDISKLEFSDYSEKDLIKFKAKDVKNFVGLGALGNEWQAINNYFGESFIIDSNMFVYPAIKRPAVDYMIYSDEMKDLEYGFLNGFEIIGKASDLISFKREEHFIELSDLLEKISTITKYNTFAFTIIAECKALMGMNLRRVPTINNKPSNNKSIFDNDNFSDWINFPVEPDSYNMMSLGLGIYSNSENRKNNDLKGIITSKNDFHLHCGIFERKLMSFSTDNYNENLTTILHELQAVKVQHILAGSQFSMGALAIFNLED